MIFHKDESHYDDVYFTPNQNFEGGLALHYNGTSIISISKFISDYANLNPEIVNYLQLHYIEYLL